ncbi:MAG: hypothetical protein AAFV93_03625, partial [Chloroflexota bacterium]
SATFSVEGVQTITQNMDMGGMELDQEIVQEVRGDYINENGTEQYVYFILVQTLDQDTGLQALELELTQEILINEEGLYVRFSDIEPALLVNLYPQEWVDFEEAAPKYDGLAAINPEQFLTFTDSQQTTMPFASFTDAIINLETLDGVEIDGQMMDVYQTQLDTTIVFSEESIDESLGLFNLDALGLSPDMIDISVDEDSVIEYIFYIGQDDGLLHRVSSIVDMDMLFDGEALGLGIDELVLSQQFEQSFDYFNFNEPITLPDPSS